MRMSTFCRMTGHLRGMRKGEEVASELSHLDLRIWEISGHYTCWRTGLRRRILSSRRSVDLAEQQRTSFEYAYCTNSSRWILPGHHLTFIKRSFWLLKHSLGPLSIAESSPGGGGEGEETIAERLSADVRWPSLARDIAVQNDHSDTRSNLGSVLVCILLIFFVQLHEGALDTIAGSLTFPLSMTLGSLPTSSSLRS